MAALAALALSAAPADAQEYPAVQLAGSPETGAIVLFQPLADPKRSLYAAFGGPVGFSAPIQVAAPPLVNFQLEGSRRGGAIAAWLAGESDSDNDARVTVALREPGSPAFGMPQALTSSPAFGLQTIMNGPGDALVVWDPSGFDDPPRTAWRPAGGAFEPEQRLRANGARVGLDDSGQAIATWAWGTGRGDEVQPVWSTSFRGAPWTSEREMESPSPFGYPFVMVNGPGLALAVLGGPGRPSRVLAHPRGTDGWTVEHILSAGPSPNDLSIGDRALGDGGHAVVVGKRGCSVVVSARAPDGVWSGFQEADVIEPDASEPGIGCDYVSINGAVDDAGAVAVVQVNPSGGIRGAYRPPGGEFTHAVLQEAPDSGVRRQRSYPPALVIGGERAIAGWQEHDGDYVRTFARPFGAAGAGPRETVAIQRQWFRAGPASACRPRGGRVIARSRRAVVYARQSRGFAEVYGCLFKRGAPVRLGQPGGSLATPTAAALSAPLAAVVDDVYDNKENREIWVRAIDLRDPFYGVNRGVRAGGDDVDDVVVGRRGGLAWIACLAASCADPGAMFEVYRLDSDAEQPRRLARGRGIAPRSLVLRGSRLTWRERGRVHTSLLR